jgi:hypothetical protein
MKKFTNFSLVGVLSVPDEQSLFMKSDLVVVEGIVCSFITGSQFATSATQNITDKEQAKNLLKSGKALGMLVSLN